MTTIGVIGAGQLGQMLGFAGNALGLDFLFLDPSDKPPAADAGEVLKFPFDDAKGLGQLAARCDVITYEFENVPVAAASELAKSVPVYPPPLALECAQDRIVEKKLFGELDIPVPGFRAVDSADDLHEAIDALGLPVVVKTRRMGYDGKGQAIVRDESEVESALAALGGGNLIAEAWVPFDREVSAIGARSVSGAVVTWPLTENIHANGILSESRAPAPDADELTGLATGYLERMLERLDYVGVLALELFVCGDELLANEFAPRVHNSGHWTIEGSACSQFENHVRAILDMPLGDTAMRGYAGMLNLIGNMPSDRQRFDTPPRYLHDYGKDPRPGRKLGHVTVVTEHVAEREAIMKTLAKSLKK